MASFGMGFAQGMESGQRMAKSLLDIYEKSKLQQDMSAVDSEQVQNLAPVEEAAFKPVVDGKVVESGAAAPEAAPTSTEVTPPVTPKVEIDTPSVARVAPVTPVPAPEQAPAVPPVTTPVANAAVAPAVASGAPLTPPIVPPVADRVQVSPRQYKFLGKTYDQPLTEQQIATARDNARADVLTKYDPEKGLGLRRQMAQDAREAESHGFRVEEWKEKQEARKTAERIKQAGVKALKESDFGQVNAAYSQDLSAWQEENAKRQAQIEAGTPEADLPPVRAKPVMPVISPARMIASNLAIMNAQVAAGADFDPKTFASHAEAYQKLQEQGWGRALNAIAQGATIDDVAKLVAQNGKPGFDPKNVVADVTKTDENGIKNRVITYFDPVQKRNITIDTAVEQAAIGEIDKQMDKLLKLSQINYHNSGTRLRKAQTDAQVANVDAIKALAGQREAAARVSDARADGTLPGATGRDKGKTTADRSGMTQAEIAKADMLAYYEKATANDPDRTIGGAAKIGAAIDQLAALNPSATSSELLNMATQMQTPEFVAEAAKSATVSLDPKTGAIVRSIPSPTDGGKTMSIGRLSFEQLDKAGREQLSSAVRNQAGELGINLPQLRAAARDPGQYKQLMATVREQAKFRMLEAARSSAAQSGQEVPMAQIEQRLNQGMQRTEALFSLARQLYANQ